MAKDFNVKWIEQRCAGKTNFGNALTDISYIFFRAPGYMSTGVFLNADSQEEAAIFSYEFVFEKQQLIYKYARYSNMELQWEKLYVDGKIIYDCNFTLRKFNFDNLKYIDADTANTNRYLRSLEDGKEKDDIEESQLPFIRWLVNNVALKNDSILVELASYVGRMTVISSGNVMRFRPHRMYGAFFESLEKDDELKNLENFLNSMGIECSLVLKKLPDGQRELYFSHEKLVPFFGTASSGTLALFDLYRRLFSFVTDPSFIYLDEFDAFYHYEMAENVMKFLKKRYPKCLIILTSHNTNLMTNRKRLNFGR